MKKIMIALGMAAAICAPTVAHAEAKLALYSDFLNQRTLGIGLTTEQSDAAIYYTSDSNRFGSQWWSQTANHNAVILMGQFKTPLAMNLSLVYGAEVGYSTTGFSSRGNAIDNGWGLNLLLGVQYQVNSNLAIRAVAIPFSHESIKESNGSTLSTTDWGEHGTVGMVVTL